MDSKNTNSAEVNAVSASKKRFRNDIILVIFALALSLLALVIYLLCGNVGERVVVKINGETVQEYWLYEEICTDVDFGENTDYVNRLVIEGGRAYISEANCPDGVCKAHRAVSKSGEVIVCLPHKLVIEIE